MIMSLLRNYLSSLIVQLPKEKPQILGKSKNVGLLYDKALRFIEKSPQKDFFKNDLKREDLEENYLDRITVAHIHKGSVILIVNRV